MRTFRGLRRRRPIAPHYEPTGLRYSHEPGEHRVGSTDVPDDDGSHLVTQGAAGEDMRGANAVFGLIGSPTTDTTAARQEQGGEDGATNDAHDLIQALHEQYCRALDDPHASLADSWAAHWAAPAESASPIGAHDDHARWQEPSTGRESTNEESIEALVSGRLCLTDVFGPLSGGEVSEFAESEPIPEILRLFAPVEYHAAAARRPSALPPALARREHHALGIDSPLSAPDSNQCHDAT
jgi:hypothetical protein